MQIARDTANEIDRAIAAFTGPCSTINADVNKMGHKFLEDLAAAHKKYDADNPDLDKQYAATHPAPPTLTEQEKVAACKAYQGNPQSYAQCLDMQEKIARMKAAKAQR